MKRLFLIGLLVFGIAGFAQATPINVRDDVSLAGANVITFEDQAIGSFDSLTIDDVTISGVDGDLRISAGGTMNGSLVPPNDDFLDNIPGASDFRFDFSNDVDAFGLQVGGTNYEQQLSAYYTDGYIETITIPTLLLGSGFYGINGTDYDSNISYFILTANNSDWIVLDELTYVNSSTLSRETPTNPVPEPATILLLSAGLFGLAGLKRRKK